MTKPITQTEFASLFSLEDWGLLCGHREFSEAIQAGEFAQAETIAHAILTSPPSADAEHRHTAGRLSSIVEIHLPSAKSELSRAEALPNAPKAIARAKRRIAELERERETLSKKVAKN